MSKCVLTIALSLVFSACAKFVPPPAGESFVVVDAEKAWARAVREFVDEKGRVDFAAIKEDPDDLHTYVAWIAKIGPKTEPGRFKTPELVMAYYLNAYNALAMYHASVSSLRPKSKIRFFALRKLAIEGQQMTLRDLENKVIRPLGDPRIHFALNCMVRGCPRLPQKPFYDDLLENQLEAAAKEFLNEQRNVQVDATAKVVRFSSILKFYTGDFLAKAPSLIAYANKYRADADKIPSDYSVKFIPYDWTRNDQPKGGMKKAVPTS